MYIASGLMTISEPLYNCPMYIASGLMTISEPMYNCPKLSQQASKGTIGALDPTTLARVCQSAHDQVAKSDFLMWVLAERGSCAWWNVQSFVHAILWERRDPYQLSISFLVTSSYTFQSSQKVHWRLTFHGRAYHVGSSSWVVYFHSGLASFECQE